MKSIRSCTISVSILCLLGLSACSDSPTSPDGDYSFPDPIDRVATDITLEVYAGGLWVLVDTLLMTTEGDLVIPTSYPCYADGRYSILAKADGFYTALYQGETGDTTSVDLDSIPEQENSVTATIFNSYCGLTAYWDNADVEILGGNDIALSTQTDAEGRFGFGNLPVGNYVVSVEYQGEPQLFSIVNQAPTDHADLTVEGNNHCFMPVFEPIDSVATNITLTVWHSTPDSTDDVILLPAEGPVTIITPHWTDWPIVVHASADGFFTETCVCNYGDEIVVDLDAVPNHPFSFAATLSQVIYPVVSDDNVSYWANREITIDGPSGISLDYITDEQGRFGVGHMPPGAYTVTAACLGYPHFFSIANTICTDYDDFQIVEEMVIRAPNLYLYPETETDISVNLEFPSGGYLTETVPPYGNGWDVSVTPEGWIDGQYGYLFYEGEIPMPISLEQGWVIDGHDLENELRRLLEDLGLVGREIEDFVEFWDRRLGKANWYGVFPQDAEQMTTLNITPPPDNLLRLLFYIKAYEDRPWVPEPTPRTFVREGYSAVEWGVIGWGK